MQADIRVAADDSQFAIPAARLGLGFGFGLAGVTALTNLVGPASTAEILLSAGRFPAADAFRMGLVNRVVAASDLRDETMTLARARRPERAAYPGRLQSGDPRDRPLPRAARHRPGRGDD